MAKFEDRLADKTLFVVRNDTDLGMVPHFLKNKVYNTVTKNWTDNGGRPGIGLKMQSKGQTVGVGVIVSFNEELRDKVLDVVEAQKQGQQ